ncbi:type VI secretion system lipoprotein TssJ [Ningiella sp. W23]|uniref:type VI secretion system lipoprotein TssJ n=1 Tax=Ningiella sp. W23 TaxID=3023715 RepID=UPI003757F2E6
MNPMKQILLIALAVALLGACASPNPVEKKSSFVYAISASDTINPDINGRPSSVLLRVYQLKSKRNFENARYEDIFSQGQHTLGAEFLSVDEYLIDPNTNMQIELEVLEASRFIGIAVGFRSINATNWRTVIAMPEKSSLNPIGLFSAQGIQIFVDELSVRTEAL